MEIDSGQTTGAQAELTLEEAQYYDSLIVAELDTLNERITDLNVRCRPVDALESFNADEIQTAIEVVSGDNAYELRNRLIYYRASTPDSCQYHIAIAKHIRGGVDALDQYSGNEWQDYAGPVGLSPENNHILTRNCGEMRRIE